LSASTHHLLVHYLKWQPRRKVARMRLRGLARKQEGQQVTLLALPPTSTRALPQAALQRMDPLMQAAACSSPGGPAGCCSRGVQTRRPCNVRGLQAQQSSNQGLHLQQQLQHLTQEVAAVGSLLVGSSSQWVQEVVQGRERVQGSLEAVMPPQRLTPPHGALVSITPLGPQMTSRNSSSSTTTHSRLGQALTQGYRAVVVVRGLGLPGQVHLLRHILQIPMPELQGYQRVRRHAHWQRWRMRSCRSCVRRTALTMGVVTLRWAVSCSLSTVCSGR
jgi:hypothetical protein